MLFEISKKKDKTILINYFYIFVIVYSSQSKVHESNEFVNKTTFWEL